MYSFVLHQSRCTNNCVFCIGRDFGDIKKNVQEELDKFQKLLNAGHNIEAIEISGNDPGEYPELPKVIQQLKKLTQAKHIVLTTHGKTLKDKDFLEKLIESGVTQFTIAIYGHNAATHDAVTDTPGSFQETFEGIINIQEREFPLRITSLITSENQHAIKELVVLLSSITSQSTLGVPCHAGGRFSKHIPDFSKLSLQLSQALEYAKKLPLKIYLKDFPQCLLEKPYEHMFSSSIPDEGYEHWRTEEKLSSGSVKEIEGRIVPKYRMMEKQEQCKQCVYFEKCPGFYKTYLEEGFVQLKPILNSPSFQRP